ncbi:antitoxin Xre/MbcA/ParS toxin-binding domain-containing protein [Paenibacillus sp. SI8]|uniref:antitoxin Xre/MbcA/ParS toxin-binding domain-containing protein n=1 Tax=unclassified Paenibacillus TaxID=185978 RepID=UPI003467EC3E
MSKKSRNVNLNNLDGIDVPEDIKEVLYFQEREYAKAWLYKNVPILDNNKPIELVKNEIGLKAVKEALLRMPD